MATHLSIIQGDAATDAELEAIERMRPKTRGECEGQPGVCPIISCRHHLMADVGKVGRLLLNGIKLAKGEEAETDDVVDRLLAMEHTCSLDAVDANNGGQMRLDDVASLIGLSRRRTEMTIEASAESLADGFSIWFGERRPPNLTTMRVAEPRRDNIGPCDNIPRREQRRRAMPIVREMVAQGAEAEAIRVAVTAELGGRPSRGSVQYWIKKARDER